MRTRRSMDAVDAFWLNLDAPENLLVIDSVMWFDGALDVDRLTAVLRHRLLSRFPVLTQRPGDPSSPFGAPHWEDDPDFCLERHLHRATLPPPGDDAELSLYLQAQVERPLDRRQPLWEVHVVDGHGDGTVVMTRFHHAVADGIALAHVLLSLTDPDPDGDLEPCREPAERPTPTATSVATSVAALATSAVSGALHGIGALPRLIDPRAWPDVLAVVRQTGGIAGKLLVGSNPVSVLSGTPGVAKRVAWSQPRPLPDIKRIGRAAGATVNDVVVTAVSAALSDYLLDHGGEAVDLTTMVPVNVRPAGRPLPPELGNRLALVLLELPTGPWAPLERLAQTKARMDAIKHSPEAVLTSALIGAIGRSGPLVERMIADFLSTKAIGATTNVPGPTSQRYLAGSPLAGVLGWVPSSGHQTVGVSVFSYRDTVRVGFKVDAAVVPDPGRLVDSFEAAVDELARLTAGR